MGWLDDFKTEERNLTDEQRQFAITIAEGYGKVRTPVKVLSFAGSGKTSTVVFTIAYLLNEKIASPRDILLTTFTREARHEMETKLLRLIPPQPRAPIRLGTFHGIAYGVIANAHKTNTALQKPHGWMGQFNIDLPPRERSSLALPEKLPSGVTSERIASMRWIDIRDIWERIAISGGLPISGGDAIPTVKARTGVVVDPKDLARFVDIARGIGFISPLDASESGYLIPKKDQDPGDPKDRSLDEAILYGWTLYSEVKRALGAWDFADLFATYAEYVRAGGDQAKLVIVDEAQDNQPEQNRVSRQLAANAPMGRFCRIGDRKQTIYGFRGAKTEEFEASPEEEIVLTLSTNFRSVPQIVDISNSICASSWAGEKSAVAFRQNPGRVEYIRCDNELARAERVSVFIKNAIDRGRSPEDFAILTRTRAMMAPFEITLLMHGVPARIQGGTSFFRSKPVRRIMSYIRLGLGEAPDAVLKADFRTMVRERGIRTKNETIDGIWSSTGAEFHPKEAYNRLLDWFDVERRSRKKVLFWGKDAKAREDAFDSMLDALEIVERNEGSPGDVVEGIAKNLARAGLLALPEYLEEETEEEKTAPGRRKQLLSGDGDTDRDMVAALVQIARFEVIGTLGALSALSLKSTGLNALLDDDQATSNENTPKVTVGTIHSSKGKEAPIVILLTGADEIPYKCEPSEEELRLFYVGCTRARDMLVFASSGEDSEYLDLTRPENQRMSATERAEWRRRRKAKRNPSW